MADYKKICDDLRRVEDVAYDYNLDSKVLGFDVCEFENIVSSAINAIETLQIELVAMRGAANSYKSENNLIKKELYGGSLK